MSLYFCLGCAAGIWTVILIECSVKAASFIYDLVGKCVDEGSKEVK